ncbi:DNA cytosine methyltransferase, partial [Streptomyces scabiei]|uniref:DNA cytosine methyltransferase n=1 Tax=Streptomyces scabiei TaxID=1930 RepID=UPI0038F7A801
MSDYYCGAGGSSTGGVAVGVRVVMAVNHWDLAIETHNTNHPDTDHDKADINKADPSRYPRTTIGWFSPECTYWSQA